VVGVAAWRLDGPGPRVLVNGASAFPMASTFKVAVAGAVLSRVDRGEITLDQMIAVAPERMVDSEILADRFIHPGVVLSVYNLLELMLTQSDNTATDYMTDLAGGPKAVTAWVQAQGVSGLRVDGDTSSIIRRFFGLGEGLYLDTLKARVAAEPEFPKRLEAMSALPNATFDEDVRDTATPQAMAELLTRIFKGRALSPESAKILIAVMERCRTGLHRLRGRLPDGTVVADKTGTIGGSVNDVGVITLPDGGRIVVAVFIKASDAPQPLRERAIADIARSVRDYFAYRP
jgi:beta-lactamase class A